MTGFVTVHAADLLRLRDAIHEAGATSAWSIIRQIADPDLKVALANDGNHWADWQRVAATAKHEDGATCDCHERMGADFYFLPANHCLKGDAALCNDATRLRLRHKPKEQPDCFTEPDAPVDHSAAIIAADEKLNGGATLGYKVK